MPSFTTTIQHSITNPGQNIQQQKEIKYIKIGKKEAKSFIFVDNMILCIENTENPKLLDLINEITKVVGHKINIQKSIVFVYTNNKFSGK